MRLTDRLVLALEAIAAFVWGLATDRHLTTDPACAHYRAPRPGSRLDRSSRGHSCTRCLGDRAWGRLPDLCDRPPVGWWCSREFGHEGPCAARSTAHPEPHDSEADRG